MNVRCSKILVVEDDPLVNHAVGSALRKAGYEVSRCENGKDALHLHQTEHFDVILLDLGLPDIDGIEVLTEIRRHNENTPVLILTARDSIKDRVLGLDEGADDYLVKPFSIKELEARIRMLSRRINIGRETSLTCADLSLDKEGRVATRGGEELFLSPREFDLLMYFMERCGEVITRTMLAEDVWHYKSRVTPINNIIDVQMHRLRDKVDKAYPVKLIHTVRGIGFILKESE